METAIVASSRRCRVFISYAHNYGDFTQSFEEGFRRIMFLMVNEPRSSWEHLSHLGNDESLLECLANGSIPGLICKELIEWLIIYKAWSALDVYVRTKTNSTFFRGTPQTLEGVIRMCETLDKQFVEQRDQLGTVLTRKIVDRLLPKLRGLYGTADIDHSHSSILAKDIVKTVREYLFETAVGFRNAIAGEYIQNGYSDFDVAEKLRELLRIHARRSKYLY